MPRRPRNCLAGTCFHVINRAVARLTSFEKERDYEAFDRVLALAYSRVPLPIYSYIVREGQKGVRSLLFDIGLC